MKRIFFILGIIFFSTLLYGQKPDSSSIRHFPHHYISINPLKCVLFQQAGISYEYRPGRFGFEISTGYIYPSGLNFGRFFIARTSNYGALEFYKGFFFDPQINFYLSKPHNDKKATLCYLSVKVVYKYMFIDSTNYHIWDRESGGDYYFFYSKQVDRLNIAGAFIMFGVKHVSKHFFVDFNLGPGMLVLNHNLIVVGEGYHYDYDVNYNISNVSPPHKEKFSQHPFTMTLSLKFGGAF